MKISLSKDAKRMIALIAGQALVIIICGAIYYRSSELLPFAWGVLLACALNCVKVCLIERTVKKAVEMQSGAGAYGGGQYLLRFVLTAVVLVVAARSPYISLWGAAAGILTLHIAAHGLRFFIARDMRAEADSNLPEGGP